MTATACSRTTTSNQWSWLLLPDQLASYMYERNANQNKDSLLSDMKSSLLWTQRNQYRWRLLPVHVWQGVYSFVFLHIIWVKPWRPNLIVLSTYSKIFIKFSWFHFLVRTWHKKNRWPHFKNHSGFFFGQLIKKLCSNPLAQLAFLLAPGHQAMGYVETSL